MQTARVIAMPDAVQKINATSDEEFRERLRAELRGKRLGFELYRRAVDKVLLDMLAEVDKTPA